MSKNRWMHSHDRNTAVQVFHEVLTDLVPHFGEAQIRELLYEFALRLSFEGQPASEYIDGLIKEAKDGEEVAEPAS